MLQDPLLGNLLFGQRGLPLAIANSGSQGKRKRTRVSPRLLLRGDGVHWSGRHRGV